MKIAVLTGDRDLGERTLYEGVTSGTWNNWKGMARVWYATSRQHRLGAWVSAVKRFQPDTVYLNTMFSPHGAILPLLAHALMRAKPRLVVAPRGMLKPSALRNHRRRKKIWLGILRRAGLLRRAVFHATSDEEMTELRNTFGSMISVVKIPNVPRPPADSVTASAKTVGELRLIFVGRVHPVKNLLFLIERLHAVRHRCSLTVVGPQEDANYSQLCAHEIRKLPYNVTVKFTGPLENSEAMNLLRRSDAMVLPTLGENFGHAIFEAFAVGTPVIISDQTCWRSLTERKAGWDISLNKPDRFLSALNMLSEMDQEEHFQWRQGAHSVAQSFFESNDLVSGYQDLFGTQFHVEPKCL